MIPLSRWLADKDTLIALPPSAAKDDVEDEQAAAGLAYMRGRETAMAEAEAQFQAWRDKENEAAARREEELAALWASRCGGAIGAAVDSAFANLQSALEHSLDAVLLPFLADATRKRAIAELLRLTRLEMARRDDPPLEVRAPAAVIDPLRQELERLGIAAVLIEDDAVEVKSTARTAIFESMAARWSGTLSDD